MRELFVRHEPSSVPPRTSRSRGYGAVVVFAMVVLGACNTDPSPPPDDLEEVMEDLADLFEDLLDGDGLADAELDAGESDTGGLNLAPTIEIAAPRDGATFASGESVSLRAQVTDDFDLPTQVAVEWGSPIQGAIFVGSPDADGQVELVVDALVVGQHQLTLSAVDSEGAETRAAVDIEVLPEEGAPIVRILPQAPVTSDTLVAEVVDPMLDPGNGALAVQWNWFRGPQMVATGESLAASETKKGETWRVVGVVSNGVDETPPGVAQVTIGNSAPRCGEASFEVDRVAKTLVCGCATREDDDADDPVEDRCGWTRDGLIFETNDEPCRFDWSAVAVGTRIGCEVVPFDGEDEGVGVRAVDFVVPDPAGNTPPTSPVVALTPGFGKADHRFTCEVVGASTDADGDAMGYAVGWSVNGHWNAVAGESVVPMTALVDANR